MVQGRNDPAGKKRYGVEQTTAGQDINSLIDMLQSGDPTVRRSAALALGALGEWRGVDALIRALVDPVQGVREAAANALVMIGTPAVDPLIALLERRETGHGEGLTQADLLGGVEGIPPAKKTLLHGGGIVQHDLFGGPEGIGPEKTLRHPGIAQHDLFGGPEDAMEHEALFPGARRASAVPEGILPGAGIRRAYAAVILGEIADPEADRVLTRALSDPDPGVRRAAEDGMVRFREKRGLITETPPAPR